jgi:hypothetical protein
MMRRKWWFKACAVLCLVMLACLLLPGLALAEEVASNPLPKDAPWWAQLVYAAVTALVGMFAVPYLARKAQAAKEERDKLRAEGLANGIQARHVLVSDLKRFLWDYCAILLEKRLPKLLPVILASKMDGTAIKEELRTWGSDAKAAAIEYFQTQGLDIVALVGDAYLDKAVRWAADRVSPFPGKDTAVQLAEAKYTNWIVEKGVDYVREQWLNGGTPEVPVKTP